MFLSNNETFTHNVNINFENNIKNEKWYDDFFDNSNLDEMDLEHTNLDEKSWNNKFLF